MIQIWYMQGVLPIKNKIKTLFSLWPQYETAVVLATNNGNFIRLVEFHEISFGFSKQKTLLYTRYSVSSVSECVYGER